MFKKISLLFLISVVMSACTSSEENDPMLTDTFDRGLMLTNIADNIIIPAFDEFTVKLAVLKTDGEAFVAAPNQTNLETVRVSWFAAYKSWQHVEMYHIGKAEELNYNFYMNIFPLTVSDVEGNVANGGYDLDSPNNHDAQGFPALDYLLYGVADSDVAILDAYISNENAAGYKKYMTDVITQMSSLTQQVVADWASYRNEFVTKTSNTATSGANKLVNDFIFYYEKGLRANKFGIPAGVFSATALPEKVEAYFKKENSKELAIEALNGVIDFFEGKSKNGNTANAIGFKQYLIALNRQDLATKISDQFVTAKAQVNLLDSNFYNQIGSDNVQMTRAYDELQKAVVLIKVDMLQAFNISVDYVDADGD
ncbi:MULTISPECIES: imelysin family protein [unclassified Polaribacter]|uniref:imelysin family protein n=1 Tax=unclassified Polaribacter TaxID=196858 RepID=UPI0011BF054A|nr:MULTISPECIES: imelysin family protein [unclassified Polaribacter]TXD52124.1 imelysin family protein [Polaribacter sp. IC063]TXD59978.1 imelysin family protein [Polaribacter sp. IC066]